VIASLTGTVLARRADHAVVSVGGVGLLVQCTPALLAGMREGETTTVATALVVREDSLTLFGFTDDDERAVFEILQTVSGVGPKLAQAVLAVHAPDSLRRIVATEDIAALTQVPGVGRKGAQRLVLELKDRLGTGAADHPTTATTTAGPGGPAWSEQIVAALVGLGWTSRDADRAVGVVAEDLAATGEPVPDTPTLLRLALRSLDAR
jgi:Holliday junction DNA helicase RuvA